MTLSPDDQRALLRLVAEAADREGCLVAPVGSLYFLLHGSGRPYSKDVDTVIHDRSLEPAGLDVVRRIAKHLGEEEVSVDQAVVGVRTKPGLARPDVELIRGRSDSKGGFFPRTLLFKAAKRAKRDGNVLHYPVEALLALKADAAVDREERAIRDATRAAVHRSRADAFRGDVFAEVNRAALENRIDRHLLAEFVAELKEKRRGPVTKLLAAAGAPPP